MPASPPPLPSRKSARELSLSASIRGAEACRRGAGGAGCVRLALLWLIYAIELLCPGTENGSNCRSRDRGVGVAVARGGALGSLSFICAFRLHSSAVQNTHTRTEKTGGKYSGVSTHCYPADTFIVVSMRYFVAHTCSTLCSLLHYRYILRCICNYQILLYMCD